MNINSLNIKNKYRILKTKIQYPKYSTLYIYGYWVLYLSRYLKAGIILTVTQMQYQFTVPSVLYFLRPKTHAQAIQRTFYKNTVPNKKNQGTVSKKTRLLEPV